MKHDPAPAKRKARQRERQRQGLACIRVLVAKDDVELIDPNSEFTLLPHSRAIQIEEYGPRDERNFDDLIRAAVERAEIKECGGRINWELRNDESLLPPLSLMRAVILQARPH